MSQTWFASQIGPIARDERALRLAARSASQQIPHAAAEVRAAGQHVAR